MATLLKGRDIRRRILSEIKAEVEIHKKERGIVPGIATIIVGDDKSSHSYVCMKRRTALSIGFEEFHVTLPADSTDDEVIREIQNFNENPKCHGILVQLPLPEDLDTFKILNSICQDKDVDGFHCNNLGRLLLGKEVRFVPCTSLAVVEIIMSCGIEVEGKEVLIIGRSFVVGKPVAALLLQQGMDATVTVAHSKSRNLPELCKRADILVVAIGSVEFVKGDWIKEGAVVVDVGINAVGEKFSEASNRNITLFKGDVEFDVAKDRAKFITPVPGGVGPLTIAFLMRNTLEAMKFSFSLSK